MASLATQTTTSEHCSVLGSAPTEELGCGINSRCIRSVEFKLRVERTSGVLVRLFAVSRPDLTTLDPVCASQASFRLSNIIPPTTSITRVSRHDRRGWYTHQATFPGKNADLFLSLVGRCPVRNRYLFGKCATLHVSWFYFRVTSRSALTEYMGYGYSYNLPQSGGSAACKHFGVRI